MHEGYCNKCKTRRALADAVEETMKNGRQAVKGRCPECGAVMFKIIGGKAALNAADISMEEACREVMGDGVEPCDCEAAAEARAACAGDASKDGVPGESGEEGSGATASDPQGAQDAGSKTEPANISSKTG